MRTFSLLFFFIVIGHSLLLSGCDPFKRAVLPLDESDELVVLTVNSPDTYYENSDGGLAGMEFDLASEFARHLGKKVRFKIISRLEHAFDLLQDQQAHFAAGLSIGDKYRLWAHFGPVYQRIQPQVIFSTDSRRPRSMQQLVEKTVEVATGTTHIELLNQAKRSVPELQWTEVDIMPDDLLSKLSEGKIDYAVVDSTQIELAKNFYPNLDVAFNLGSETGRAWAFPLYTERAVLATVQQFFDRIRRDGTLKRLLDRYYGHHIQRLEQMDVSGILSKRRTLLPDLLEYFHEAEELTGIDWRLIAALGYQESHWNRLAVSPNNVRGLMMLTEITADRMKVTDRLDSRQSILGGARYLAKLKDRLPTRITEPDRTWIALAAYNQGRGHVEDARILAQRMGLNPDSWLDLKTTLPLLSLSKYHSTLKHGFARGGEAVILTESVRTYYKILMKYEPPYSWGFPVADKIDPLS